jgi:hypothetical protein
MDEGDVLKKQPMIVFLPPRARDLIAWIRHGPMDEGDVLKKQPMIVFLPPRARDLIVLLGIACPEFPAISVKVVAMEEDQKGEFMPVIPFYFGKDEEEILFLSQSPGVKSLVADPVRESYRPPGGKEIG